MEGMQMKYKYKSWMEIRRLTEESIEDLGGEFKNLQDKLVKITEIANVLYKYVRFDSNYKRYIKGVELVRA